MKLSEVDKNFAVNASVRKDGMVFLDVDENPFRVYGIYRENGKYRRMPEEIAKVINPGFYQLHSNTAGGRVRFRTDSPKIARLTPDEVERLEIIRTTYKNAISSGDKNVYLMEGSQLMAIASVEGTVDGIHPNDFGFYSMAKALKPLLEQIL